MKAGIVGLLAVAVVLGLALRGSLGATPAAKPVSVPFVGMVTGNGVNVRMGAGTEFVSVMKLSKGGAVHVVGEVGGWYQVGMSEQIGVYVASDGVKVDWPWTSPETGRVKVAGLTVRAGAAWDDGTREVIGQLRLGDAVTILEGASIGYDKIKPPEGTRFFISQQYVKTPPKVKFPAGLGGATTVTQQGRDTVKVRMEMRKGVATKKQVEEWVKGMFGMGPDFSAAEFSEQAVSLDGTTATFVCNPYYGGNGGNTYFVFHKGSGGYRYLGELEFGALFPEWPDRQGRVHVSTYWHLSSIDGEEGSYVLTEKGFDCTSFEQVHRQ